MAYQAPGVREGVDVEGAASPALMMLEHANLADPFAAVEWDEQVAERFDYWVREHARENPAQLVG